MKAELILSNDVEENFLSKLIENSKEVLSKGVPKGKKKPEIKDLKIFKNKIQITLESDKYVRPHEAILRLRKFLDKNLSKFKSSVRDIIVNHYEAEIELEEKPDFEIKLPFVDKIEFGEKSAKLIFKDIDVEALEKRYVDRIIKRLEEKIREKKISGKAEFTKVVRRSERKLHKYAFKQDPTPILEKEKWVIRFSRGVWIIMQSYASLIRAIEELIIDKIAKPLGFEEIILPKIVPLDVMKRKGQLVGIPNEMFYVCSPKSREKEIFEEFIDYVKITDKIPKEMLMNLLDYPEYCLAYAQCEPFYEIFYKKIIDLDKLPLKFYDRYGPTYRYEAGGLKGLERLTEFKRIEFTFIGKPEDVIKIRNELVEKSLEVIDKIFDLEWSLEATTAVYLEHAGIKEEEFAEYVRTYDISVTLPFETPSKPEKKLEIASYHVHEDFYAKNFKWKEKKNRKIWSGCAGLSPSRWAYVFIVRYGLNYEEWPDEIKKYIGKNLPKFDKSIIIG